MKANISLLHPNKSNEEVKQKMKSGVAVVLIILWLIGFLGYQAGGLIHIFLVLAIIAILLRVIQGRKAI